MEICYDSRVKTSKIMVIGPPASGKTTFIKYLVSSLKEKNQKCVVVDDYSELRKMCPPNPISEKYVYKDDNIVLEDKYRENVLEKLYINLKGIWEKKIENMVIMEVTHPEINLIIKKYFLENSKNELGLIYIDCPILIAKNRNLVRDIWRIIPDAFMDVFKDNGRLLFGSVKNFFGFASYLANDKDLKTLEEFAKLTSENLTK